MFERALPASPSDDRDGEHQHTDQDVGDFACVPPEVVGVPFPTAAYDQNLFYAAVGYLLGLAMTMVRRLVLVLPLACVGCSAVTVYEVLGIMLPPIASVVLIVS